MNTGKFIVVEGLEGAGKTTAMQTIYAVLTEFNIQEIVSTREPGGTEKMSPDREDHYTHLMRVDALRKSSTTVWDFNKSLSNTATAEVLRSQTNELQFSQNLGQTL